MKEFQSTSIASYITMLHAWCLIKHDAQKASIALYLVNMQLCIQLAGYTYIAYIANSKMLCTYK